MAKLVKRMKTVDRRVLAVLALIPAFVCLCCCGIFFLAPTDTEPTAAVAQNTAVGESARIEVITVLAQPASTAVTVEVPADIQNPTQTVRLSSTPEPAHIPQPTSANGSTDTPTPQPTAGTNSLSMPADDLATVTEIIDGDTIDVAIDGTTYRVRYIGMDTPERGDYFFSQATEANGALVEGQVVILVKDVSETDRFGRLLRYVYLEDGMFVNAELVRLGYAVIATFPPDVRHQALFLELEREAREASRGLWAQPVNSEPTPSDPQPTTIPAPTNVPAPVPTNPPAPTNVPQPTEPANCDPAYPTVCIPPPPPDLDCVEIPYRDFTVLPPDPHHFDGDNDGVGCET